MTGTASDSAVAISSWRIRGVVILFASVGLVLVVRLLQIQVWQHQEFQQRADQYQTGTEIVPARPGDIVDREDRVLATSIQAYSLYLDPSRVSDPQDIADRLALILPLDAAALAQRLREASASKFLWVQRRLTAEQAVAVRGLGLSTDLCGFRDEHQRHYPQGPIAAHLLGLRDVDNLGHGGLEEAYDADLRGTPGQREVRRDARGFVTAVLDSATEPPRNGARIETTIDSLLQLRVERRLQSALDQWQPKSVTAIVMNPQTGELLTLACAPTFDPNRPGDVPENAWKNQAIASVFEPGSTFKPLVVAWALDRGRLERNELLHCGWGSYRMGRRVLHDHHAYGELSVTDVLVKSSNVGMAKIGERLENSELQKLCTAFGFGRSTGLGLPGELAGIVRPFSEWNSYSTGSIPMGQELAATPLQIITAHAALASGGRRIRPRLVRQVGSSPPEAALEIVAPIVNPDTARWLIAGPMREVVTRGTGKAARIPGYSVFGKTGTAQVVDAETGRYSHNRHICSFLCGAPVDDPQLLVLVVLEEPQGPGVQYGGTVAAPIARDVLQLALEQLHIPPDLPSELPSSRMSDRSSLRDQLRR
ncbi:MAG: peptidoglycan D,D-transpeptidase FtsI family protein [Planctomycetaceae bacterium]